MSSMNPMESYCAEMRPPMGRSPLSACTILSRLSSRPGILMVYLSDSRRLVASLCPGGLNIEVCTTFLSGKLVLREQPFPQTLHQHGME